MRALLISEKPDLMRQIKACYDKHRSEIPYNITFTSQRGHLLTSLLPEEIDPNMKEWTWDNLPFYPQDHGGWQYKIIEEKKQGNFLTSKERFSEIKNHLDSGEFDFVIHAGDPDQEGELLVNMVLTYAKNKLPVKRFWTNDLTDEAVLHALKNLKDDQNDRMLTNLLSAAYARQHWDYIFGMNISRGASIQMHGRAACGRVKTVLLNIVVQREKEIANFKPKTVYGVKANYQKGFEGTLFNSADAQNDNEYATEDQKKGIIWFDTKQEADNLIKTLSDQAKVIKCDRKHTQNYSPKLFKLSTLQVTAGKNGIKDDVTLSTIQGLYEKQILSYPRTDCEYLSSNEDFEGILRKLNKIPELSPFIKQITPQSIAKVRKTKKWINDKALEESGHSALKPTTTDFDYNSLSELEKKIYMLIAKRFVAMFLPPLEQDTVEIVTEVNGNTFRSTGKTTTAKGYTEIFGVNVSEEELPIVTAGEILNVSNYKISEKTSTCPSRFTSPDLIAVCENPAKYLNDQSLKKLGKKLKIGTPATRSGIIRQLATPSDKHTQNGQKGDGYLEEKKEGKRTVLIPTTNGTNLINNLNGLAITKVDMTGMWEERLEKVRNGQMTATQLDSEMRIDFEKMLNEIKNTTMNAMTRQNANVKELNCACPFCNGKIKKIKTIYVCENHNQEDSESCPFILGTEVAHTKIEEKDIVDLCTKGETKFKRMVNKTGKVFFASLKVNKETKKIDLNFEQQVGVSCPKCHKNSIQKFSKGYRCTEESCKFVLWDTIAQKKLTEKQLLQLCEKGETNEINGFKSKSGNTFSAKVHLNDDYTISFIYLKNHKKTLIT